MDRLKGSRIIVISLFVLGVAAASSISHAYGTTQQRKITYVLLLNPSCDDKFRDNFDQAMHLNNTDTDRYINYYEVTCMGGVTGLSQVNEYILPILRFSNPSASFVFVYPDSMKAQFENYIGTKFGEQYRYLALGSTDIPTGSAFANEMPAVVKHEMGHLGICGTWHDDKGRNTGTITRYLGADDFPWC